MSLRRRHGLHGTGINLTPLIDMSLMLVVFFVLCLTTSQEAMRALMVSLPRAGSADAARTGTLEVVVERGGGLSIERAPITIEELSRRAAGCASVTVAADQDAKHGRVVEVVDCVRRAGVNEVYYAATAPPIQDW
jgi:biopolymer transport protein ExbD